MNATSLPARHPRPDPGDTWKAGAGQRITYAHTILNRPNRAEISPRRHDITDPRIAKASPPLHPDSSRLFRDEYGGIEYGGLPVKKGPTD